ncbi:MAG: kelch repeat-containing protein [candidate division WOR-3 bacterium]
MTDKRKAALLLTMMLVAALFAANSPAYTVTPENLQRALPRASAVLTHKEIVSSNGGHPLDAAAPVVPDHPSPPPTEPSPNAQRVWQRFADFPDNNGTYRSAGCTDGRYHYVGGGWIGTSGAGGPFNKLWRYDPATDAWTELASMPTAISNHCMICHRQKRKIFIPGGYPNSVGMVYDIASNEWGNWSVPLQDYGHAGAPYGDSILVVFGSNNPGTTYRYSIPDDEWAQRASASGTTSHGQMDAGAGGLLYYAGGWYQQTTFIAYDPSSNSWSTLPSMPTGRHGLGLCAYGPYVLAYGGAQAWTQGNWVECYDVTTNEWTREDPMPYSLGGSSFTSGCRGWAYYTSGVYASPANVHIGGQVTPPIDVGVTKIVVPSSPVVEPGMMITPVVEIANMGMDPAVNFPVTFRVDSAGVQIYEDGVIIDTLMPDETLQVTFTNVWQPNPQLWHGYTYYTYTYLAGDMLTWNDTMWGCAIYTADTIYSNRTSTPPTIDGYMAPNEWTAMGFFMNFSNAGGQGGKPWGPYTAQAWFMHDENYLYAAYALPLAATKDVNDQIGFYCDENNDGQWATDNSEGNFWYVVGTGGSDQVLYRPILPGGPGSSGVAPGAQSATGVFNGYLVFETKTPFGTMPYQLNLNTENDTCGVFFYGLDNGRWYGWWPADLPYDSVFKPYLYGTLILQTAQFGDVGVKSIDAPRRAQVGATFRPKATYKNFGNTQMAFTAFYFIEDPDGIRFYSKSENRVLGAGQEVQISFPDTFVEIAGTYTVRCSTAAAGDINPNNDYQDGSFECTELPPYPPGWMEMRPVPGAVKDGAWLAMNTDNGLLYGARGNKSGDFYVYDPTLDSLGRWTSLATWPLGSEAKPPAKGAAGCYGDGYIYAVKGNNTPGFWRYSIADNAWQQLENVPLGTSGRHPKGGTDMVYVVQDGIGYVYLLKGYAQDFFRFNTSTMTWQQLPDAPAGAKPKWDKGSWLVYDGDNLIYAHKAKYHELWTFNLTTMQWSTAPLQGMPYQSLLTGKTKKSKDGGSAAYYNGYIYALKGGNTCAFYRYSIPLAAWSELPPMPEFGSTGRKKMVKQGGDIAAYGEYQMFFAFKGGKTAEFWRYVDTAPALFASQPERSGVMGEKVVAERFGFSVVPNPVVKGYGLLSYSVPQPGEAKLTVFDVTGREVLETGFVASGTGTRSLDLRQLAAGVYLVRFEAAGASASQKLIVR